MKLKFFMWAAALLCLISCSKKDETRYSCNPDLNNWITTHRENYENISRDELAAISSIDTQRVIYKALSSKSKRRIWTEKLVLAKQTLTPPEQAHIDLAIARLHDDDWATNESKAALSAWSVQWANTAFTTLGWDSTKAFLIAETWLTEKEMMDFKARYDAAHTVTERNGIANTEAVKPSTSLYGVDCTCRSSLACKWFTSTCEDGNCDLKQECGFFGSSNCTGLCISRGSWNVINDSSTINNPPTEIHK